MRHLRIALMTAFAALMAGAAPALAHTGFGHTSGVVAGVSHPIGGLDHLLAMLSVGIWSALVSKGRTGRVWVAPAAFVTAMLVGASAGYLQAPLPLVEAGVALSVVVLGVMILTRVELPLAVGAVVMALFAIYHGHAHGAEATGAVAAYMVGFAVATATLHLAGIGLGLLMTRAQYATIAAGTLISATGAFLLAS